MAMLMARPSHVPPTVTQSTPPPSGEPAQPMPVVTPLEPSGAAVVQPTPTRDVLPPRHVARPHAKVNKVVQAPHATPSPHQLRSRTPDQVQAKYRTVKSEYTTFKTQYGPVLEDKWNAIASEITFGKADKFDKVDAMLDALRREMAKVKAGG